jgi:hypothetical protein
VQLTKAKEEGRSWDWTLKGKGTDVREHKYERKSQASKFKDNN